MLYKKRPETIKYENDLTSEKTQKQQTSIDTLTSDSISGFNPAELTHSDYSVPMSIIKLK